MSLSQEPAFSTLKQYFVCGYTDITDRKYSGMSGKHVKFGNAVHTTNGAGPKNLQLFMLSSDGTVLHCLPGFWDSRDLVNEMSFASQLNEVWKNRKMPVAQKKQLFKQMQLAHINQHSKAMVHRSHMQGFDQMWEAKNRLDTSDTIKNRKLVKAYMVAREKSKESGSAPGGPRVHLPSGAFKTTDVIMHERMAKRPFVAMTRFDVAKFADYGKPIYDKNEDARDVRTGRMIGHHMKKQMIGNPDHIKKKKKKTEQMKGWGSQGWGADN